MVVILILPSSSEQTPPPSSSSTVNGCDQFRLNGAHIINNNNNNHHGYRNRNRTSAPKRITFQTDTINQRSAPGTESFTTAATTATASKSYVRHVTRVNISDVYSQIEIDGEVKPVTKEGKSFHMKIHNDTQFN